MKTLLRAVLLAAATAAFAAEEPATRELPSIFDGKTLAGWKPSAAPEYWTIKDGVITGQSDTRKLASMLWTEKTYADVIVECEVRFSGEIDSGIHLRKPDAQVQIGVSRSLKRDMTCSFYVGNYPEEARAAKAAELLKKDDWNRIRVLAKGDTFTVWLNGTEVSRYTTTKHLAPAPIGLQIHANLEMKVEFRNIKALALE